VRVIMCYTIL